MASTQSVGEFTVKKTHEMEGAHTTETNEPTALNNSSISNTVAAVAVSQKKSDQTAKDDARGAASQGTTTSNAEVATISLQGQQTESTFIDLNIVPASTAKLPRKRKSAPKPGELGYNEHMEIGRLKRLKYKEIANQKARDEESELYRYRMNIARGYQLFSGAKLLEDAAGAPAAGHPIAKQHLNNTLKTMREEADNLWKMKEDAFGSWEQTMLRLCKFMLKEGHMEIGKGHPEKELNQFIRNQRKAKSRSERDPPRKEHLQEIHAHKIKVLNMIGFRWTSIGSNTNQPAPKSFEEHFQDLLEYKAIHGDCLVPNTQRVPKENRELKNLTNWVVKQRRLYFEYHNHDLSKPRPQSMMTQEQMDQLNSIGFVWNAQIQIPWEQYFNMLVDFREREGHCKVPQQYTENPPLGAWVHRMRRAYRDKNNGSAVRTLTDEKIAQLEALGFVWKTKATPKSKAKHVEPIVEPECHFV